MSLRLDHVVLRTGSLARSTSFYHGALELAVRQPEPGVAEFSARAGQPPLLVVREEAGARPPAEGAAGLFHLALLLPDAPSLAAALDRLVRHRIPLHGLSDHGVSEAIYLADPDGNGLELYRDRPRGEWPMAPDGRRVAMVTRELDLDRLVAALPRPAPEAPLAGAVLGHVHLSVRSLERSREFYVRELGLAVMQDDYPGAVFLAAEGYHHHLALNVWRRARTPLPPGATGLAEIVVSQPGAGPMRVLEDPDGIRVLRRLGKTHRAAPA